MPSIEALAIKEYLLRFASGSDEGKEFFANTGFTGIRDIAPGLMESMDAYAERTRQLMSQ
jgi:hypothetical protein